ncbi:nineteen complex-related protein 2-domain-containing protein [Hypoxylon sp. FL1150]|nr:nineteen complex-related protein 2-domain-containing protein [Hypoxylon sp. FL1150]
MSSFGSKRKARKITVQDDDDDNIPASSLNPPEEPQAPALQPTFKTNRKPFKQSALRKSINIDKLEADTPSDTHSVTTNTQEETEDNEDGGATLRVRPSLGARSGSTKNKKRASSSRLSFGGAGDAATEDEDSMVLGEEVISTPKRGTLAQAAAENIAYKKGIAKNNLPLGRLPMRSADTDDDRPRYSKEYLSELQMSTPNTPQNLSKLHPTSDDEMALDPSEIEGAVIVDTSGPSQATAILTEAEIQEKKARRARRAKEGGSGSGAQDTEDFISLSDDDRGQGDSYLAVLSRRQEYNPSKSRASAKNNTRLVAEDEDLGEGFDEFVEDGGLSLGKKAEREARRRQRAEMASLITVAEGGDSDGSGSDDSEAERRAAYEAAQTRAGMDGLAAEREQQRRWRLRASAAVQIPRITPLPDLNVLMDEFRGRVRRKQDEMSRLKNKIAELQVEREGIVKREPEVQRLLDEAGERYRALMSGGATTAAEGASGTANGDGTEDGDGGGGMSGTAEDSIAAARSLLDQARGGADTPGQRGLESLGTTPVRQQSRMEI